MRTLVKLVAVTIFFSPLLSYSLVTNTELKNKYADKILTLRQFYSGDHLHFDANGELSGTSPTGPWTIDGTIRVKEITFRDGVVHIQGQRQFLFYDPEKKTLRDVALITKQDSAHKRFKTKKLDEWAEDEGMVDIEIECGQSPELADTVYAVNQVFLSEDEPLTKVLPNFWAGWTLVGPVKAVSPLLPGETAYRVGQGISAPQPTYSPDPEYSDLARSVGYRDAIVVLWLVVEPTGLPDRIRVVKPAGLGLDEKAVDAVRTWKFDPAMSNGSPVPVQINVEVTFKLY
jgi:TonB family protein